MERRAEQCNVGDDKMLPELQHGVHQTSDEHFWLGCTVFSQVKLVVEIQMRQYVLPSYRKTEKLTVSPGIYGRHFRFVFFRPRQTVF